MTTAEANRRYFDSVSDSYDAKPWWTKVNNQVIDAVRTDLTWIGIPLAHTNTGDSDSSEIRLLDYACGTGLMTRVFGPYVTKTRGIDISPNMVSTYNSRARDAGVSEDVVHAVAGDLFDKANPSPTELTGPEWQGFDLATVGFGFHHFEDVVFAASQLKERLRPGGVLVITDFLEGGDLLADENGEPVVGSEGNHAVHSHEHGHDHGHNHGHSHGVKHEYGAKHEHGAEHKHASKHDDTSSHSHSHHHGHAHQHHHDTPSDPNQKHDFDDSTPEFRKKMIDSIVVPHFTIDGVRKFFTEAGFVDIDVFTLKEKSYMEFGGNKIWRTVLFARGRKPVESAEKKKEREKSEL